MKAIPHWVTYTVLRLLMFLVPLAILMFVGLPWWLSAILAAIVGFCLSYLLLSGPRHGLARDLADARKRDKPKAPSKVHASEDDDVEDQLVDEAQAQAKAQSKVASEGERGTQGNAVDKPDDSGQLQH